MAQPLAAAAAAHGRRAAGRSGHHRGPSPRSKAAPGARRRPTNRLGCMPKIAQGALGCPTDRQGAARETSERAVAHSRREDYVCGVAKPSTGGAPRQNSGCGEYLQARDCPGVRAELGVGGSSGTDAMRYFAQRIAWCGCPASKTTQGQPWRKPADPPLGEDVNARRRRDGLRLLPSGATRRPSSSRRGDGVEQSFAADSFGSRG